MFTSVQFESVGKQSSSSLTPATRAFCSAQLRGMDTANAASDVGPWERLDPDKLKREAELKGEGYQSSNLTGVRPVESGLASTATRDDSKEPSRGEP
jgi:hypothetical protein